MYSPATLVVFLTHIVFYHLFSRNVGSSVSYRRYVRI